VGLETTNTIAGLDSSWPLSGDPASQGDNHLRLIKAMLKSQFPGLGNNGFAKPIVATEDEINYLSGVTGNIQLQLDTINGAPVPIGTLNAPVGTRMVFHQATPPAGWTQDQSFNDNMLRVVSGFGGGFGGSDSPIQNNKVASHTHSGSISTGGSHTHTFSGGGTNHFVNGQSPNVAGVQGDLLVNLREAVMDSGGSHSHGLSINSNTGSSWTPKYIDIIVAVKD